jgi:hypothetical protein
MEESSGVGLLLLAFVFALIILLALVEAIVTEPALGSGNATMADGASSILRR